MTHSGGFEPQIRRLAGVLCQVCLLVLIGNIEGRTQISPGELSKAHSALDGTGHCTDCHNTRVRPPEFKCLECHTDIRGRLAAKKGLHPSLVGDDRTGRGCAKCHAEHNNGTPKKLGIEGEELPKVMYRLIEAEAYTNSKILVVGGGDSAVEAALGLASQEGNQVSLSYRRGSFSRIKERNERRIEEYARSGKVCVLFNSNPVEIKEEKVVLDCGGEFREIPNDFVWIFAGGIPPNAFLEKIGVRFGTQTMKHTES